MIYSKSLSLAFLFLLATIRIVNAQTAISNNDNDYILGNGDVISVKVYDNPDLTADYKISNDGSIVFPLIGTLKIYGISPIEVQYLLTRKLEQDYIFEPIVSVDVKEYRSQAVYILGNVEQSGIFYLEKPTLLFDLLSKANVLSKDIGKQTSGNNVRIIRQAEFGMDSSKDTTFIVSLSDFLNQGNSEVNIRMKPGDIVYIPNTKLVHVVGEVKKPGSFNYENGMTVLKAISLAGGRTNASSQKNIIIKRIVNNKETRIKVKMSDLLNPDDIIEVPLSIW
jgi:polysaccharide export outer membrane protein